MLHLPEVFAIIVQNYNYFPKGLNLRSLTGFRIRLSLNKCLLTCRVTLRYLLYDTCSELSIIVNSDIFSHIHVLLDIFSHIHVLYRNIQPYYQHGVTLAYSEPRHIQNPDLFRIEDVVKTMSRHILLIQNAV